jgi:UDP-N-acetylglucosamine:LPS N-acetylglucosamine transferase
VSSVGGHLSEVRAFLPAYGRFEHFYVLNDTVQLPADMTARTTVISHAERDWRVFGNFVDAWRILRRRRPSLILTAGAGPAVPFALVGKVLGIPTIFIETAAQVSRPSLTGRLIGRIAARTFYQWESLATHYPMGTYGGPAAWSS